VLWLRWDRLWRLDEYGVQLGGVVGVAVCVSIGGLVVISGDERGRESNWHGGGSGGVGDECRVEVAEDSRVVCCHRGQLLQGRNCGQVEGQLHELLGRCGVVRRRVEELRVESLGGVARGGFRSNRCQPRNSGGGGGRGR